MKHIGMDVHSATSDATVLNDRGRMILRRQILTREYDLIDFMLSIPGPKRVALEDVYADSHGFSIRIRQRVYLPDVFKDCVGFCSFFWTLVLATVRKR